MDAKDNGFYREAPRGLVPGTMVATHHYEQMKSELTRLRSIERAARELCNNGGWECHLVNETHVRSDAFESLRAALADSAAGDAVAEDNNPPRAGE